MFSDLLDRESPGIYYVFAGHWTDLDYQLLKANIIYYEQSNQITEKIQSGSEEEWVSSGFSL